MPTGLIRLAFSLYPTDEKGNRKSKHHQWLTEDLGHPKLLQHLSAVVALMRAPNTWQQFKKMVDVALPKHAQVTSI